MPLFSIVVPVYKVSSYLRDCVDSVLNQSFKDIELILVDDASPDDCPRICDEYAAKDERVNVVHLEKNSGLSAARNAGIGAATGEYFLFLDSDDFYCDGNLQSLAEYIHRKPGVQVVFLSFRYYQTSMKRVYRVISPITNNLDKKRGQDFLLQLAHDNSLIPQVGTKLVKADFLHEFKLYFRDDRKYIEDYDWTHNIMSNNANWGACDFPHYMYRVREGSLTSPEIFTARALTRYTTFAWWATHFKDINANNREANFYFMSKFYGLSLGLWVSFDKSMKPQSKRMLKEYSWILDCAHDIKTTFVRIAYKIFGFTLTAYMLSYYMKFRNWQLRFRR